MAKKRKIKSVKGKKAGKKGFVQREKEMFSRMLKRAKGRSAVSSQPSAPKAESRKLIAVTPMHREAKAHLAEKQIKKQFSKSRFFEKIGRLLPQYFTSKAHELLIYNGIDDVHVESWVGKLLVRSIIIAVALGTLAFVFGFLSQILAIVATALVFTVSFAGTYAAYSIGADKRAKQIEQMLPSALQLMSANIRAGMTPDKAVWLAARPEFGALMGEIKRAGAETMGGTPITEAFMNMSKRVRSRTLERTVNLISEGLGSGGEIAKLLNETSNEIRAMGLLQKEMEANVAMYSMFIIFASLVGAPLLLAISTFFVEMLSTLGSLSGIGDISTEQLQQSGVSLTVLKTTVSSQFLTVFSAVTITVTTFAAALLLGIIKEGNEKRGLEYAPVFIVVGLAIFAAIKFVVTKAFGSILG
ncbi:TPA: type II secretion system F family protein [archaeon]|nr:type II secretion system F family protein [Candidatus Naiadarchaeales archaeon SRR2090159.bin1288]